LQLVRVFNDWDFAGRGNVFLSYSPTESRSCRCACWKVYRPGYQTDPESAWYDGGWKSFTVCGKRDKLLQLEVAKQWAGERYKIEAWAKSSFGAWMDAELVKQRLAEFREQLKSLEQKEGSDAEEN